MKLEVLKDKFQNAVYKSEKIAGRNMSLPVLNSLYLEASANKLLIKSTNLDLGVEIEMPAKVEEEGRVAVSASILNNFISNISEDKNITLDLKDGNLKVGTNKNSTLIKSINAEDFPIIPRIQEGGVSFKINPKLFTKGLRSVYFSASNSNIKPELSSVMVESRGGEIFFAATDSFRLAEKKIQDKNLKEDITQILIPIRNVTEIIRILEDANEDVLVVVNKNQISFSFSGVYLTSRVIDGSFPDYKQLIPKEFKSEAVVLKQDFLNAMKVSTVFSDKFNQITFKLLPKEKKFSIETLNSDVGENRATLDAALSGEPIEIKFNYKYILDTFQPIESDSVMLNLNDNSRPMIIRGVGDNSFTYLVMPLNR